MESAKEIDRPTKRQRFDEEIDQSSSSSSPPLPPPATPEEFLPAAAQGDDATVASALRNPRVDPNMTGKYGYTALMMAAEHKCDSVVKLLLADKRVDPNIADEHGETAVSLSCGQGSVSILRLLLADERTIRTRPDNWCGQYFDAALAWLNRQGTEAEATPEEFVPAARSGDDATVASALRNQLTNPNMTDQFGCTAIMRAVGNAYTHP